MSYEAYQKWDYAMKICGTEMSSCTTGLKTLTNTFDDASNGSASAIEKFERLGLSVDQLSGMSREDMFATVVTALQNVEDETEKAALANDMFGKSGQNLLPLFNMTQEELQQVMPRTMSATLPRMCWRHWRTWGWIEGIWQRSPARKATLVLHMPN